MDVGVERISGPLLSKWMNKEKSVGHSATWQDFTTFPLTELDSIDRLRESAEQIYGDDREKEYRAGRTMADRAGQRRAYANELTETGKAAEQKTELDTL